MFSSIRNFLYRELYWVEDADLLRFAIYNKGSR